MLTTLGGLENGKDVFFELQGRGRLRVTLGTDGPGGFGIMHIVEGRMLKDAQDLDGAIRTVLRVFEAAVHGEFFRHKQGRENYRKDGAIAVIAHEKDKADGTPGKGDFVLAGYEEFESEAERKRADARTAALRRAVRYALPPHARSEEVVAALHNMVANLRTERQGRSSVGGGYLDDWSVRAQEAFNRGMKTEAQIAEQLGIPYGAWMTNRPFGSLGEDAITGVLDENGRDIRTSDLLDFQSEWHHVGKRFDEVLSLTQTSFMMCARPMKSMISRMPRSSFITPR